MEGGYCDGKRDYCSQVLTLVGIKEVGLREECRGYGLGKVNWKSQA